MKSSSNVHRRTVLACLGLGAVATAVAFTFTLNSNTGIPIKWPAGNIPLTIMLGSSTTLFDGTNFNTSARTAAQAWNSVIGSAQFQTTFATGTPDENNIVNEMAFGDQIFGRDFDTSTLAITTGFSRGNERTKADIIFNTKNFTWDSYRGFRPSSLPENTIDLQRVAIHELGHVLGLDHPNEKGQQVNAIMNSRISLNVDTMTADDIEGAQSLYGPPGMPANDAFANATLITLAGSTTSVKGVNTNATKEAGELRHADNPGGRSVWWRWTAPSSGTATLDTGKVDPTTQKIDLSNGKSSYYDTTLAVYTGTSVGSLTSIASDDDIEDGVIQASTVTFNATAGTTYRIAVDGFNNIVQNTEDTAGADNGGITLNLAFGGTIIGTAPSITTQPSSFTVNSGGSASFSVTATGTEPLSYQWNFNTNAIAGATNSNLSLSGVTTGQAGTYTVTVSNTVGSTTSTGATLTVNTPAPPAPPPSSGGGGGGGAPSLWFCAVLASLGLTRLLRRRP